MAKRFAVEATVSIWVTAPDDTTEDDIEEKLTWDAKGKWLKIMVKGTDTEIDIEHPSQDVDFSIEADGGVCDDCHEELDEDDKCTNPDCASYESNNCPICGEELDDGECASCTGGTDEE